MHLTICAVGLQFNYSIPPFVFVCLCFLLNLEHPGHDLYGMTIEIAIVLALSFKFYFSLNKYKILSI